MHNDFSYGDLAYVYDLLTDDVEYGQRTKYVEKIISKHLERRPEIICDLGCGTGTVCTMFSDMGYDCIGIDSSEDMLSVAYEKNTDGKVLYLNQDIADFELYGTVDVFLSMLDTINYITDEKALLQVFKLVDNYLNPGGLFIFDVNTLHKFENILGTNTFAYEKDDVFYTWENYYEDEILEFFLNFFVLQDDGKSYKRFSENHVQKYYSCEFLKKAGESAGLELVGMYSDLSFEPPQNADDRIFFVFRKGT